MRRILVVIVLATTLAACTSTGTINVPLAGRLGTAVLQCATAFLDVGIKTSDPASPAPPASSGGSAP